MFLAKSTQNVLVLDPNFEQVALYSFIDQKKFQVKFLSNPGLASEALAQENFDLVFLSCSFSNKKLLHFLESLKQACKNKIIPLVLVVDFEQSYSIVPGIKWDQRVALLGSQASAEELNATLARLL